MSIFELKLWYSKARDSRDQLWYLIVLSVILRRLNQIQNALPMFHFCFHSKYCIQQNKLFSTQNTKNMPKNNHFRKHIHRIFQKSTFLIEKNPFSSEKIHFCQKSRFFKDQNNSKWGEKFNLVVSKRLKSRNLIGRDNRRIIENVKLNCFKVNWK